jgi:hypothetical protein
MCSQRPRRRQVLALAGTTVIGVLAGCTDGEGGSDSDGTGGETGDSEDGTGGETSSETTATEGDDGTGTATATPGTDELDLREANVVGVEFAGGDGSHDLDVTLHHDDGGEEGYANWWQVERLDGSQLGRRDLLHPHSQQPFTRSATVDVPAEVSCAVVRGHDQTHGYGGRAVLANLETGETVGVTQGADPQSFDDGDCPS